MRKTFSMPISGAAKRRSAIAAGTAVAAAALLASGLSTGTAGAAPAKSGAQPAALTASARAELLREANATKADTASSLGLGAKEKLVVKDVIKDADGTTHTRYDRTYDGLPVLGGDLIVHRAKGGDVKSVTKATKATVKVASTTAGIAASTAAKSAVKLAKADDTTKAAADQAPRKVIWAADGKPVLAYETVVGGVQKDGTPNQLHVITDAATGKKLYEYQGIETGKGESEYSGSVELGTSKEGSGYTLTDADRGGHKTTNLENGEDGEGKAFTDDDDNWGTGKPDDPQTAAVDAHYGAAATWDYYKNVHGRDGIGGDGKGAYSRVHYGDSYVNAFWDDSCFCMTYGDGQDNKAPLTALDVAGHEMSHGVTSKTAGLEYTGESGGLNEATSDIFGTSVEFNVKNTTDVGDYLIGEAIDINGDGTPLRYMDKPSKDGQSADNWSDDVGNQDVHYSSGVANHFFYLLSEGSGAKEINGVKYDSPTSDGSKVEGIGRDKAEKIWYKALTTYMTSNTDYHAAREATLKAATDLYGADSAESKGVDAAWAGVNVK
ncbi:M4 family metallopeptidase [Streptomyces rapamycinicus]|uniref:Neutral metalloproteinase n=3 Tax=Streptomyces rapamycinicus TaxID=1226757 RepID=A0A0A0ND37_STRRN|nr:peptidase [Streptomyces rapamycinicus NRRL 5491]MBB4782403.1 Zn-dependent metalloprotease [Streptomyces rapamycinicus]RLV82113.1 peptidase M4 thermolysin [Streptomyces rapamycinicus NRRL 5491]